MNETVPLGFMLFFVCSGLLLAGLSIPLLLRRVKPNYWYGLRVRKTLSNEQVWYESNVYAAKWLLALGLLHTIVSFTLYFIPAFRTNLDAYAATCGIVFLIGFALVIILSFRHLHTL